MTRLEAFKVLRLTASAGPASIKQAYRKLAFELHPDLNPDLPNASKSFQELNEAYVLLMQEYANTSYGAKANKSSHSGTTGHDDAKTRAEAYKAYEKAKSRFDAASGATSGAKGSKAGAKNTSGAGAEATGNQYRKGSREEFLRDLLSDPFARRVFEDIYSHLRHEKSQAKAQEAAAGTAPKSKRPARALARPGKKKKNKSKAKPAKPPMLLSAGSKAVALAGKVAGGVKGWLRRQIDDEQVMYLPGESLYPGMRIRLQVKHGFSDKSRTVEFTLPPEFQIGRPIRLKGLGKHLGKIEGDLYLRVYSREELEEEE